MLLIKTKYWIPKSSLLVNLNLSIKKHVILRWNCQKFTILLLEGLHQLKIQFLANSSNIKIIWFWHRVIRMLNLLSEQVVLFQLRIMEDQVAICLKEIMLIQIQIRIILNLITGIHLDYFICTMVVSTTWMVDHRVLRIFFKVPVYMIRLKIRAAKFKKCIKLLQILLKHKSIKFMIPIIIPFKTLNLWMEPIWSNSLDHYQRLRKLKIIISKDLFLNTL